MVVYLFSFFRLVLERAKVLIVFVSTFLRKETVVVILFRKHCCHLVVASLLAILSGVGFSALSLQQHIAYANFYPDPSSTGTQADLSGTNLSGADLSRTTLRGANLSGANLSGTNLSKADLRAATLSEADLSGANLRKTDLREGTKLDGANLSKADLREANLSGADLSNADLSNANLSEVDLSKKTDLTGATLNGADLSGANLSRNTTVTPDQLTTAKSLKGTTMPDGTTHS